ncbi:hypothetical protein QO010_001037 [Caulobacter ginsengisoli]|uniref:DUF2474 domain-containing protein n=1 Tax=Caulobacter ginsengisoli TaxID=400775 RepID=A0ABU0IQJ1_9CAUL|nr:hypothetical protein [Caulobacter ginsengisoli]
MPPSPAPRWASRLLWFVGLWLAGVCTVGAVSLLIRAWIR